MLDATVTEVALAGAMKDLLSRMPLSKISVKDLADYCHINRKTYYYHFKDKYDLIQWIFMEEFYKQLNFNELSTLWDFLEPLSTYFYENKAYYVHVFAEKGQNSFSDFFSELVQPLLKEHFEEVFSKNEFHAFYADYATAGFVLIFEHWLRDYEEISPETFIKIMKNAVYGLAEYVLSYDQETHGFRSSPLSTEGNGDG